MHLIGNNIIVFQSSRQHRAETVVYLYDVDKEKWSKTQCGFTKGMFESSFVKYYS